MNTAPRVLAAIDASLIRDAMVNGVNVPAGTKCRAAIFDGDTKVHVKFPGTNFGRAVLASNLAASYLSAVPSETAEPVAAAPRAITLDELLDETPVKAAAPAPRVTGGAPVASERPGGFTKIERGARNTNDRFSNGTFFAGRDTMVTDEEKLRPLIRAGELLETVGLNWTVSKHQLIAPTAGGVRVPNAMVMRDDTRECLGVVGEDYEVVQNADAFGILDAIVTAGAEYVGAGSFGAGGTTWVQVDLKAETDIGGGDIVRPYVLVRNSHDGTGALRLRQTPVRVVCWNTLGHATRGKCGVTLGYARHTASVKAKVEDMKGTLAKLRAEFYATVKVYKRMAETAVAERNVIAVMDELFPLPEDADALTAAAAVHDRRRYVRELMEGKGRGSDLPGARGTAWGLYNALTEYADWTLAEKSRTPSAKVEARLAGRAATFKADALDTILGELKIEKVVIGR